jgi:hypothetical protein
MITESEAVLAFLGTEATTVIETLLATKDFFADHCDVDIPLGTLKRWSQQKAVRVVPAGHQQRSVKKRRMPRSEHFCLWTAVDFHSELVG